MPDSNTALANDREDDLHIVLGPDAAIHPRLLETPSHLAFGDEPRLDDVVRGNVRLRVGRRPIAQNVRTLYERRGQAIPEQYEIFWGHELWLVNHSVGIIREGDGEDVEHLCYELRFPQDTTVVDVLPQYRFVSEVEGRLRCEAEIGLNGRANTVGRAGRCDPPRMLYFGGELSLADLPDVLGRVSFDVLTPRVQAIGAGDVGSQFVFSRHKQPMMGSQSMLEMVLVDKHTTELQCAARLQVVISGLNGVPTRMRTEWIPLLIKLTDRSER